MKGLWILGLILLAAGAHFIVRGVPAYRAGSDELAELRQRTREMQTLFETSDDISNAEVDALSRDCAWLTGEIRARRQKLLDASLAPPLPGLTTILAGLRLTAMDPLRESLLQEGHRSPRAERALSRILTLLEGYPSVRIRTLELGESGAGDEADLSGTKVLALPVDLVLVGGLSDLIGVLESFAPGQGAPIIWVRRAGLQRIEPSGWSADGNPTGTQAGPPVRLSVSALVLFAATDKDSEP